VFPKGITHVETLVAVVEDPQSSLPDSARAILKLLVDTFTALEAQITTLDVEIKQRSKSDPTARRLMTIPGVGPIHQVPAQSVDALGALTHQEIAGSEHDAVRLLLFGLDRNEAHARPLGGFTDRLCIGGIVLLPLDERLDVGRRDQAHVMAHLSDLTRPVVRTGTGFHRHDALGLSCKKTEKLHASDALAKEHMPSVCHCSWPVTGTN